MKILHFINSLDTRGAEKLLIESVPLYQKKNIDTDVLCLKNEITLFWKKLSKTSNGNITGLTNGSIYNPFLVFKIIPFLKRYDIVHTHLFPALYWVVLAKWFSFSKVQIIYTEHSTTNRRRNSKIWQFFDRLIYKGLSGIITISEEVDANLKAHLKNDRHNYHLIKNGVDVHSFYKALSYAKQDFFSEGDFILIQVSSFARAKDQSTLIKSLKHLPSNIKLLLIGEGELLKENKNLMAKLDLSGRMKFLGNRPDIPRLLKTADIIVLSSHHEGLSLSNIEGMSAGKPFIGSDVPGIRDIVKGYGVLFPESNTKALAESVKKLSEDEGYYNQIADQCYQRAQDFGIHKMVNEYIKIYKELV